MAKRQVLAGHWQRPARGVYVTHARELTGLELGHAAAALAGDRVVLSGLVVGGEVDSAERHGGREAPSCADQRRTSGGSRPTKAAEVRR